MSIRRNALYTLAGQLAPLFLALATIPALLGLIGDVRYGVLALVWLLVGYLGLFDLGMGPATSQKLARMPQNSPDALRKRASVFWTSVTLNVALGVGGALLAWPIATYFFGHAFAMDEALRQEVLQALPWIALTVPVATASSVLVGALQAQQRFVDINLINTIGHAGIQLVPLWWAWHQGPAIPGLVQAVLATRLLTTLVLLQRCSVLVVPGQSLVFDRRAAGELMVFGGWVTVTAVIGPLMVIADRFLIGWLFGARAVSQYTIPFQLAERVTMLSSSLNFALFPSLAGKPTDEERRALGRDAVTVLVLVLSPLIAAAILLIGPFLSWWISADMAAAATHVAQVLFLGFWVNSLALVPYTQLQAQGRPDLVAKCHVLELLPYLVLLYLALQQFGLMGAAVVFCLRAAVDFLLLAGLAGGLRDALKVMAIPACALVLVFALGLIGPLSPLWHWVTGLALLATLMAWSVYNAPPWLLALAHKRTASAR